MGKSNRRAPVKKSNRGMFFGIGAAIVLIALVLVIKAGSGGQEEDVSSGSGSDLTIPKSEVTETAKFYPYTAGKTKMEVIAVKAPDGSIRTALNTCQVCYDSGRGYYKQQGDELVCQNCGNRFKISQVEKIKGGCNPVPILKENKTEDDSNIVVSAAFLEESKGLFVKWKK